VELTSLFDDLARAGQEPATKVLEYTIAPASDDIAEQLNLPIGSEVLTVRRLRSSGGQPLALMTNHLPAALAPDRPELEQAGLYQALRSRGVHIRLARQRIGAKAADRDEARLLNEKPKAPLLTMNRTAFDDSGRIVEYGSHVYRAARYYFETTLVDR
jgi:DNA-binding GntR family transcriptional regulator